MNQVLETHQRRFGVCDLRRESIAHPAEPLNGLFGHVFVFCMLDELRNDNVQEDGLELLEVGRHVGPGGVVSKRRRNCYNSLDGGIDLQIHKVMKLRDDVEDRLRGTEPMFWWC